jgi:hypothetical protein
MSSFLRGVKELPGSGETVACIVNMAYVVAVFPRKGAGCVAAMEDGTTATLNIDFDDLDTIVLAQTQDQLRVARAMLAKNQK